MYVTPTYPLEKVFDRIVATFGRKIRQSHCGGEFTSCGDNGEVTVSFRKNTESATLCVYDNTLMSVYNSGVRPVYRNIQQSNGPLIEGELLENSSRLANRIIAFILQNIPRK